MKFIFGFFILFTNLYLILQLNGEPIIHNPLISNKTYIPINYKILILSDSIDIKLFDQANCTPYCTIDEKNLTLVKRDPMSSNINNISKDKVIFSYNVLKHYENLIYYHYSLSPDFFAFIDYSYTHLFFKNKIYNVIEDDGTNSQIELVINLNSSFLFIDYIKRNQIIDKQQEEGEYISNETIIYGKENEYIAFYYINSNIPLCIWTEIVDNNISCKLLELSFKDCFICIYSQVNRIKLSILYYTNERIIKSVFTYENDNNIFFSEINEPILYDTDITNLKLFVEE